MSELNKRYYAGVVANVSVIVAFFSAFLVAECSRTEIHKMYMFAAISTIFSFVCFLSIHFDDIQRAFVVMSVLLYSKLGDLSSMKNSDLRFCAELRKRFETDEDFCYYMIYQYDKYMNNILENRVIV